MSKKKSDTLPPELVREILLRVSVKDLLKFRCVCKPWCSLIDSTDFIYSHHKFYNNNNNTRLLAIDMVKEKEDIYVHGHTTLVHYNHTLFTIHDPESFLQITQLGNAFRKISNVGSIKILPPAEDENFLHPYNLIGNCNGLLLVRLCNILGRPSDELDSLILTNPCIRKSVVIPVCPIDRGPYLVRASYVLGFAPSSHDYKVLAVLYNFYDDCRDFNYGMSIAIYSLNDNVWRTNPISVEGWDLFGLGRRRGFVFVRGAMYWIGCERQMHQLRYDDNYPRTHLLSFDFDTEKLSSVQLPLAVKNCGLRFVFLLGESVAVFVLCTQSTSVWVMDNDDGEDPWRLWFTSKLLNPNAHRLFSNTMRHPLSNGFYIRKSNTLLLVMKRTIKDTKGQLMSYNINTGKIQLVGKSVIEGKIDFDTFVESLVLHRGFDERHTIVDNPQGVAAILSPEGEGKIVYPKVKRKRVRKPWRKRKMNLGLLKQCSYNSLPAANMNASNKTDTTLDTSAQKSKQ